MRTIDDFRIENNTAILDNVAFAEEAKVVEEFLRCNTNIKYATVSTKDKRYFELKNGKLISTKEERFLNSYYGEEVVREINEKNTSGVNTSIKSENFAARLDALERELYAIKKIINLVSSVLKNQ